MVALRTRIAILKRDGHRCVYCGRTSKETSLQVDHILPRSAGGADDPSNLVAACFACNNGKGADASITPPTFAWEAVRTAPGVVSGRCRDEAHPGPYVEHIYGPEDYSVRDLVLTCDACGHIVAVRRLEPVSA